MEHLPPVRWDAVATTRDLDGLERRTDQWCARIDQRFDALESRLRAEIHKATVQRLVASVAVAASVVGALTALGG